MNLMAFKMLFDMFVKCAKIPRSNISGMSGMQMFQECQGQIFQECVEGQMPRSNKVIRNVWNVRNFRNAKVKFPKVKCQGQIPRSNFPRSNGKKWESVTKIKKP